MTIIFAMQNSEKNPKQYTEIQCTFIQFVWAINDRYNFLFRIWNGLAARRERMFQYKNFHNLLAAIKKHINSNLKRLFSDKTVLA